jgi:phenylpropionate dioxygenase-like ring-hydroxylating dioxygenase large terminal subunit
MFEGFSNVWTPVLLAKRLRRKPVGARLAGEPVVLFRGADGQPAALIDRCPHRGVRLSLGKVTPDGCLECPFHGWRFDTRGANRHVPLNPDARRERLSATALPVRQVGELLFVFTGTTAEPPELNVPRALIDPGLSRTYVERTWSCHWTRAMENMLDSPHLPFVHRTTIGAPLARQMTERSRMVVEWEDTPWGGRQRSSIDEAQATAHLDFYRPNMMALHIPLPGRRLEVLALVIPVDERTTRLLVVGARDFMRWRLFNPLFAKVNAIIADQDRAVVESSQPPVVPPPSSEVSVATDRATLAFRSYYFAALASRRLPPGAAASAAHDAGA